jgi:hypothetical protein
MDRQRCCVKNGEKPDKPLTQSQAMEVKVMGPFEDILGFEMVFMCESFPKPPKLRFNFGTLCISLLCHAQITLNSRPTKV